MSSSTLCCPCPRCPGPLNCTKAKKNAPYACPQIVTNIRDAEDNFRVPCCPCEQCYPIPTNLTWHCGDVEVKQKQEESPCCANATNKARNGSEGRDMSQCDSGNIYNPCPGSDSRNVAMNQYDSDTIYNTCTESKNSRNVETDEGYSDTLNNPCPKPKNKNAGKNIETNQYDSDTIYNTCLESKNKYAGKNVKTNDYDSNTIYTACPKPEASYLCNSIATNQYDADTIFIPCPMYGKRDPKAKEAYISATTTRTKETDISSKETDISAKETYISAKETDISAKETDISAKETGISATTTNIDDYEDYRRICEMLGQCCFVVECSGEKETGEEDGGLLRERAGLKASDIEEMKNQASNEEDSQALEKNYYNGPLVLPRPQLAGEDCKFCVQIEDVEVKGEFIQLRNISKCQEIWLGGFFLVQTQEERPLCVFCFPCGYRVSPGCSFKVFSVCGDPGEEKEEADLVCRYLCRWCTRSGIDTALCMPNGCPISKYKTKKI